VNTISIHEFRLQATEDQPMLENVELLLVALAAALFRGWLMVSVDRCCNVSEIVEMLLVDCPKAIRQNRLQPKNAGVFNIPKAATLQIFHGLIRLLT
jgi:hypothetical protein